MSKPLNTAVDSGLFVSTTAIMDGSDTTKTGEYYTLSDFENKSAFLKEIQEDYAVRGSMVTPTFVFSDVPTTFKPLNLIGDNDLDAQVWQFLEIEDEDQLDMTVAFAAIFGMENGSKEKSAVEATRELAESRYFGKHDNDVDYAYSELENRGFMENLPPIIENNLDIDTIASQLIMNDNVKISEIPNGRFYFRSY